MILIIIIIITIIDIISVIVVSRGSNKASTISNLIFESRPMLSTIW